MKFEVHETSRMREEIDKYKRLFEKYTLFPYVFRYENKYYYYIDYSLFNRKLKGVIILNSDGSIADRDIAIKVFEYITIYNTAIGNNNAELIPYINNPVWQIVELINRIESLKKSCDFRSLGMSEQINQIIENYKFILQVQDKLSEISQKFYELGVKVQEEKGILTVEDVKKIDQLTIEWKKLIYESGRKQLYLNPLKKEMLKDLNQKCLLANSEQKKIKGEVITLLLADINTINTLKKSLRKFEIDKNNKRIAFSMGEKGLNEMIKNLYERSDNYFEKKAISMLRN